MARATKAQRDAAKAKRERMRELAKEVSALSAEQRDEIAARYGIVTIEGHKLSGFNATFVAYQAAGQTVTIVGGFRQWKRAGRSVRKGEHGFSIWFPQRVKVKDKNGDETDETETVENGYCSLGTVFDISQTEPIENAETETDAATVTA